MDEPALLYCTLPREARELFICVGELLLSSTCVTLFSNFSFAGRIEWVITHPIIWKHAALELIRKAAEDAGMPRCVSAIRPHVKNHNQPYFECSKELLPCFTVIVYSFFLNPMMRHYGGRAMSPPSCMAETCSSTTGEELQTSCATRRVRHR
jgi:hypothetical protein